VAKDVNAEGLQVKKGRKEGRKKERKKKWKSG
jgi:hypothetical protein